MVKNFGGKNCKKIARKNAHSNNEMGANKKMRFAKGDEELYGIVTKCLGNSQFLIICNDRAERLCILRNKFTGRNKHSNLISIGSWVIIGIRNWETSKPDKKDKCDMLEVYTNNEKHRLLQESKVCLSFLSQQETLLLNNGENQEEDNNDVIFSEIISIEQENNEKNITDKVIPEFNENNTNDFDEFIDIDEI